MNRDELIVEDIIGVFLGGLPAGDRLRRCGGPKELLMFEIERCADVLENLRPGFS